MSFAGLGKAQSKRALSLFATLSPDAFRRVSFNEQSEGASYEIGRYFSAYLFSTVRIFCGRQRRLLC